MARDGVSQDVFGAAFDSWAETDVGQSYIEDWASSDDDDDDDVYIASDPRGQNNWYANQVMSQKDQQTLSSYGDAWNSADAKQKEAVAAGNSALADYYQSVKDQAHADAEALRAEYGYSGGTDGSEYDVFEVPVQQQAQQQTGATGGYGGNYDLSEYLQQASAAQIEAELAGLKDAYEKSMAGYDAKLEQLPQTYDAARNNLAAQDAIARKSFDERAVASGLSSGASGQVELARSSAYQRDLANIDQAEANAVSEIELAKANLQSEYENAIAAAKASGNAELATALYQELLRVQGLNREDAQLNAAQNAAAQELALKYAQTLTDSTTGGTPQTLQPTGKGYDNGSLTPSKIKELQAHYGLTQDGMWGPNSQKTTGMSAEDAWTEYQNALTGGKTDSTFWTGKDKIGKGDFGSFSYDPDEGIFVWNGDAYYDVEVLLREISDAEAQMSAADKEQLKRKFNMWGFDISFD